MGFRIVILLLVWLPGRLAAVDSVAEAQAVFQKYCFDCHGNGKAKAGISFDEFSGEVDLWRDRGIWLRVRDAVRLGDMPPEKAEHALPAAKREALGDWVAHTLQHVDVTKIPKHPGHVPPRRLNRHEYAYTVQDLFGIPFDARPLLPADLVEGSGFDNAAATLSVQPLLIEKYIGAARQVTEAVWRDDEAVERLLSVLPPGATPASGKLPFTATAAQSKRTDMGDGSFAVLVRFKTQTGGALFSKAPATGEWVPDAKTLYIKRGRLIYDIGWMGNLETRPRVDDGEWHHALLNVADGRAQIHADGELLGTRRLTRPDKAEHRFRIGVAGDDDEFQPFTEGTIAFTRFYDQPLTAAEAQAASGGKAIARKPVYVWDPTAKKPAIKPAATEAEAVRRNLEAFLQQAFRRPPTAEEMTRYLKLFAHARDQGDPFREAFRLPVKTALVSPAFLFRAESTGGTQAQRVTAWELANRLSYFLWASQPDTALSERARSGELLREEVLRAEVKRLLADERAQRFVERFTLQWLRIDGLGTRIKPDAERFPQATPALLRAMKEETVLFADSIMRGNQPVTRLLDADYTFVNTDLARHYGMPTLFTGADLKRRLTKNRGGLLTQASVLTVSSSPRRTSPVFRGKWILEVLLGQTPPPPPANVPELKTEGDTEAKTIREALAQHRRNAACNSCHKRIDPLGFALEAFDATGRLRPGPVDTAAQLQDGTRFDGHTGLRRMLLTREQPAFTRQLSTRLLAYALGRELEFTDEAAVQGLLQALRENDLRAEALIQAVVASYPFQYRQAPASETP